MTIYLLIAAAVIVLLVLLDRTVQRLYQNSPTPHKITPDSIGISHESVWFPAIDGGTLHGWWIPGSPDAPVLILVHGWANNAGRLMDWIEHLHRLGYTLLAIDTRNHGDSSPFPRPSVWSFSQDTQAAVHYVSERFQGTAPPIGLVGFSVGGGASINTASVTPAVRAVLTVGAISHPLKVMRLTFDRKGIPYFPLVWMFFKYLQYRFRIPFHRIAPVRNIPQVHVPVFLIHGEVDDIVPVTQGQALLAAADRSHTRLWVVPGKGHGDCDADPQFWDKVEAFLQDTLKSKKAETGHGEAGLGTDRN